MLPLLFCALLRRGGWTRSDSVHSTEWIDSPLCAMHRANERTDMEQLTPEQKRDSNRMFWTIAITGIVLYLAFMIPLILASMR